MLLMHLPADVIADFASHGGFDFNNDVATSAIPFDPPA